MTHTPDLELLRCPFCNKRPVLEKFPVPIEECFSGYLWTVVSSCGVQMQGYGDRAATINKWNLRGSTPREDKLSELLQNIIKGHKVVVSAGGSSGAWSRHVQPAIYEAIKEVRVSI